MSGTVETAAPRSGAARDEEDGLLTRALDALTSRALAPRQLAVVRIGFACTWLLILLREMPHRHVLWGPDSPWGLDLAPSRLRDSDFNLLMWFTSDAWFELVYFCGIAAALAMLLGWRTRLASVLLVLHVVSLDTRNPYIQDGGDTLLRVLVIYLAFTHCGAAWSLDARRRARSAGSAATGLLRRLDGTAVALWLLAGVALAAASVGGYVGSMRWGVPLWGAWIAVALAWAARIWAPGELRIIPDVLRNLVHNTALLLIMFQVCVIYAAAGLWKVQGSLWQEGTATYYPLTAQPWAIWPEINEVMASNWLIILATTYGTVLIQTAFPFTLWNRRVKNVLLVLLLLEHIGIGVMMGLTYFSMSMISADLVFLPTAFLVLVEGRARLLFRRRSGGSAEEGDDAATEERTAGSGPPAQNPSPLPQDGPVEDRQPQRPGTTEPVAHPAT